jgi:hypothetical protein
MAESNENRPGGAPPPKRRRGRPKWMPPNLLEVENLAARGLTQHEIAYSLGVSPDTLYERKREYSEFSEALRRGRSRGITALANVVFEVGLGEVKRKDGTVVKVKPELQVQCAMFFLRTRAAWKEMDPAQVAITIFGPDGAVDRAERAKQRELDKLSKIPIDVRRKIRDLLLEAKRRGEEIETDAATLPDDDDWNGGENSNGGK